MAVKSFQQALQPGIELRAQLVMYPVATMKELMTQVNQFIRAEEDEVRGRENFGLTEKVAPKGDNRSSRREDRRRARSLDRRRAWSLDRRRHPSSDRHGAPSTLVAASGGGRASICEAPVYRAVNTVFNEPIYKLIGKIKTQPFFKWPQPMKGESSSRDQSKF
ncbi:hypothetical protein MRB53_027422 [Persea americana]|uniref:Uncharacterized protein n=1 Tax=Persea americana TaxID=3435 RepID=A0ACC2LM43_PERAE|nr:hypothetical protein MRB53_027422 [Persea americana]